MAVLNLKFGFRFLFLLCLCVLMGCSTTYNPATGRNELIFISTPEEVALGENVHQQLSQQYKFSKDRTKEDRVNRIGQRLAQVSDRQDFVYHFYLIEKDELNAFTTPGGNIYFFSGLYDKLSTDEEIAGVLSHEIGHTAARHTVKKFQAALGYNLVGSLVLNQLEPGAGQQAVSLSSSLVMNIIFSSYGRQDEFQADRLGVKYMHLAGYNPHGMLDTLEVLKKEDKGGGGPLLFRSHPYTKDRIEAVKKEIASVDQQFLPKPQ